MILPLTQSDSTRPIYFADGKVFSFNEHTPAIIAALNLCGAMAVTTHASATVFEAFKAIAKDIVGEQG